MKILFCIGAMNNGGAERVVANLANYFSRNNIDVSIVCIAGFVEESYYKLEQSVVVRYVQTVYGKKLCALSRIVRVWKILKEENPDVIISFLPHINVCAYIANMGLGIPHITSERNNPYIDPTNILLKKAKEYVFSKSNGLVCQTHDAKQYFTNKLKTNVDIKVIMNPISEKKIMKNCYEKEIVNTGRLTTQKNQKLLIDAFDEFYKLHKDYVLKIYGKGELESYLKDYANRKPSNKNIIFMGTSKTWLEESKNATMFILSSNYEGMPNTLIEAMSVGIPCISTDCPIGGAKEVIEDSVNGFLVPVGDVEQMTRKMCTIAENKELQIKFSRIGAEIKEKLDINKIGEEWLDFIRKIIFDSKIV